MKTQSILRLEALAMLAAIVAIVAAIMMFVGPQHFYHGAISILAFFTSLSCEFKIRSIA